MDNSENNVLDANREARVESIKQWNQVLIHASSCETADCTHPKCSNLKKVFQHIRVCKDRKENQCSLCKQIITLCCFHAKKCTDRQCKVFLCGHIRARWDKFRHQQNEREMENMFLQQFELISIEE